MILCVWVGACMRACVCNGLRKQIKWTVSAGMCACLIYCSYQGQKGKIIVTVYEFSRLLLVLSDCK